MTQIDISDSISTQARALFAGYNQLVALMPLPDRYKTSLYLRPSERNGALAEELHEWLCEESITPMAYLASAFAKHTWRFAPKLRNLLQPRYKKYFAERSDEAYLWAAAIRVEIDSRQPVQIPVGKEIIKQRMLAEGGPLLCRRRMFDTGGYNPYSKLCGVCEAAEQCRAEQ
jgi:hypothetical protein